MTKKEIFESTVTAVTEVCTQYGAREKLTKAIIAVLEANIAPKKGGSSVNIDEVTKKDADGNITHIQCSVSGIFLPATAQYFYEDKNGKGINGLKRLSRQAEGIRKKALKVLATSEKAIMADVLDGKLSATDGKRKIEALKNQVIDYSSVAE